MTFGNFFESVPAPRGGPGPAYPVSVEEGFWGFCLGPVPRVRKVKEGSGTFISLLQLDLYPGLFSRVKGQLWEAFNCPGISSDKSQRNRALPESPQLPGVPCGLLWQRQLSPMRAGVASPILITSSPFPTSDPGAPGHSPGTSMPSPSPSPLFSLPRGGWGIECGTWRPKTWAQGSTAGWVNLGKFTCFGLLSCRIRIVVISTTRVFLRIRCDSLPGRGLTAE